MMSRTISTAAMSCRGCQRTMLRAIVASAPSYRGVQQLQFLGKPSSAAHRMFSSTSYGKDTRQVDPEEMLESAVESEEKLVEQPWFLEVEPPRHPPSQHIATLPKAPEDGPELLESTIKYIYEDMGLDDIALLDLRDLDPPASLGPNLIMLFATARSERHLHIASGRFVRWLKRTHDVGARADGMIGAGELKTKLRRLRKKAKLLGTNTAMIPEGDQGISTGWVCVNFDMRDGGEGEAARIDESGQFSGFGSTETGTTVVIQCLTESRREELDLESLWEGILRRSLDKTTKVKGGPPIDRASMESILKSKLQIRRSAGASQWTAMQEASRQHRYFSTSARRLEASAPPSETLTLADVREQLSGIQLGGASLSQESLYTVVRNLLCAPSPSENTGPERLALVDQLLQTAEERGLDVKSRLLLVTLIDAVVRSPAYDSELARAQKNLEFLLAEMRVAPDSSDTWRLMTAYAFRQDWDAFWNAFREPARYALPRAPQLYLLAYQTMASTKDPKLCRDAMRWVYPEMLTEHPSIKLDSLLRPALESCVLVADPQAREFASNPEAFRRTKDIIERRRIQNNEFARILREVDSLSYSASTEGSAALNWTPEEMDEYIKLRLQSEANESEPALSPRQPHTKQVEETKQEQFADFSKFFSKRSIKS